MVESVNGKSMVVGPASQMGKKTYLCFGCVIGEEAVFEGLRSAVSEK